MPRRRLKKVDNRPAVLNVVIDGSQLLITERCKDGGIRIRQESAQHVCFVRKDDVTKEFLSAVNADRRVREVSDVGDFYRLRWRDRWVCKDLCKALHKKGVKTYEGDVNPIRRWMTDKRPKLGVPRICYLDIETDSRVSFSNKESARILCWAVVGSDGSKKVGVLKDDTDRAEKALLSRLLAVLEGYDLICAWNGDRFDFPVIESRIKNLRLPFVRSRWLWLDQMELFKKNNSMSAESGAEKQSFKLDNIASSLLGEGKDDFDASRTWEAWDAGGDERRRMVRYCVKDTDLLRRIEDKVGHIALLQTLTELCNVFTDSRGMQPTVQAEGFLLMLAADQGIRFPTQFIDKKNASEKYKGAYVMEPQVNGITKNVHVADFASLYPSIMITWNMSPETLVKGDHDSLMGDGYAYSPLTDRYFSNESEGILPHAVKLVMKMRKVWSKKQASFPPGTHDWVDAGRRSSAYKIAANSFYGVIGSPMSRFFSRDVAESTTQCGKWLIQETIKEAQDRGMFAVYGDTDSVFVAGASREEFEEFVEFCNEHLYPKKLKSLGCSDNRISLAYEKEFERIVFTSAKRYAGRYVHYKGAMATEDSKPEVKGLEYKRGDTIRLTRDMQAECVDLLVGMVNGGNEDVATFEAVLHRWQSKILFEPLTIEEVVITKGLGKPLNEYVRRKKKDGTFARQLPHIELARLMQANGEDVSEGTKISYFIFDAVAKGGKEYRTVDEWDGSVDRYELWDNIVYPPTMRLLAAAFPEHDWKKGWARTRPKKPRKSKKKNAETTTA